MSSLEKSTAGKPIADGLSPYDTLNAVVRIFSGNGVPEAYRLSQEETIDAHGMSDPWMGLYKLQDMLKSVQWERENPHPFGSEYSSQGARAIIACGPEAIQSAIDHLKRPEVHAEVEAFVARLRTQPDGYQNSINIVDLVDSGQLIPKLEEVKVLVEEMKRRTSTQETWAGAESRGIKPRPTGQLAIE